jgi:two-component system, OmpR family, alkaline phosphatase synthesis response regulator PhoP
VNHDAARVLIVDDEPAIQMAIRDELEFEGFDVEVAATGPQAVALARSTNPDVLLLDLMLPGQNGFEVCRTLRKERPDLWIIMLTVRGQESDRVTGFESGADDYVTKPFSLRELVGRIKVGLRRSSSSQPARRITFGDVDVDLVARRVLRAGRVVDLTPKEYEILALLVSRPGEAISRDEFLNAVWGLDVHVTHRNVDTHLSSLRRKIEADPDAPAFIVGVRGVGYRFDGISAKS